MEDTEAQDRIDKVKSQIEELQKKLINISDSKTADWTSLDLTGDKAGILKDLAKRDDSGDQRAGQVGMWWNPGGSDGPAGALQATGA